MKPSPEPRVLVPALVATGLLLAAALAVGCISTRKEVEIGRQEAAKVAKNPGLVSDLKPTGWVREVGSRLAEHAKRQDLEYVFNVVDMPEPNAFALPGGYVYISRGILAMFNDEHELAGVVGHEIGHIEARHSVKRLGAAMPVAVVFGVPSAILGAVSPALGGVVGGMGGLAYGLTLSPYSREQEREADRIGQELAAAAGYEPLGLTRALNSLQREHELHRDGPERQSFFATHPATSERVAKTEAHGQGLQRAERAPIANTQMEVLSRLEGLLLGANPKHGAFLGDRFVHPDLQIQLPFPQGWKGLNAPSAVIAQPPGDKKTGLVLQVAGTGTDPVAQAAKDGVGSDQVTTLKVGSLPAARLVGQKRGTAYWITWVAHRNYVLRIIGITPSDKLPSVEADFRRTHDGLRPLSEADRARIREYRLRTRPARGGESLKQFVARTGSGLSAEETAVLNGLELDARLEPGTLMKVSIGQPYRGR